MTDTDRVSVTRTDGIAEVRLDRPEKRNAMDLATFDALAAAGAALKEDPDLRAVILHGAGEAFCAGIDLAEMAAMAARLPALKAEMLAPPEGRPNRFQAPCTIWAELPVPVIAAVHGVAYGAGLQLALGADIRILAPDARLSVMEARWGLIPDMGISQSLPRLMRADQALDLMLTARVVGADEALALGLATAIAADPLAEARARAKACAAQSPGVLTGAKRLVQAAWRTDPAALRLEAELQAALIGSPDQVAAVMRGMRRG
ncbi:MAG: crotonase/enoyl-CoA hydratase family protein [Gemmobacter sp.]